jgi:hypothetical protein
MKYKPWKRPPLVRSNRIITVRRSRGDAAASIDLVFYADQIKRFLRLQSRRLRQLLRLPRTTELEPVSLPANVEKVIIDARTELQQVTKTGTTRLGMTSKPANNPVQPGVASHPQDAVVVGRLINAGEDQNTLGDRSFMSPFVELEVDELGGRPRRFWGKDLPRALKDSGAVIGDRIRLKQLGTVPVKSQRDPGGEAPNWKRKSVYLNVFEIEVLEHATLGQGESNETLVFSE